MVKTSLFRLTRRRTGWLTALILGLPVAIHAAEALPPAEVGRIGILNTIWNHQFSLAENIQVSVGRILIALFGLAIALTIAHTLARVAGRGIRRRFTLAIEHAEALEKGVFYLLATLFVLTILNWLSIPLTVFAFFGGAIAIGIGFGTQALMNNFISGLILLLERGIRVGDLISVDGNLGRVTKLGSRCSQIRQSDGVEVLVPNSMFLEKNVVNWTLTDPQHRYDFTIAFAYGTHTASVADVLKRALTEHSEVLREPAPAVYFEGFGENALIFHVYYWISLDRSNPLQVGSEIRLRMDALCRDAGLAIALPQRDLRLRTAEPIPVRLENPPRGADGRPAQN